MRRLWIVVALLAFGYTLLPSIPASAGYGAIARDESTGKYGGSLNQSTRKLAEEAGARRMRCERLQDRDVGGPGEVLGIGDIRRRQTGGRRSTQRSRRGAARCSKTLSEGGRRMHRPGDRLQ